MDIRPAHIAVRFQSLKTQVLLSPQYGALTGLEPKYGVQFLVILEVNKMQWKVQ